MVINWYVLKFLFDDGIIQQLTHDSEQYQELLQKEDWYQERLEETNTLIQSLLNENNILRILGNIKESNVDIDDERISKGKKEVDKKSPHSSFSRKELRGFAKNVLAANERLYIIELYGDTNSMEPDIDDHTLLIFEKYDDVAKQTPLSEQDIIQYKNPKYSNYFIHRIREIKEGKYRIKGDNNRYYDGWFDDTVIRGRYVGKLIGKEMDGEVND